MYISLLMSTSLEIYTIEYLQEGMFLNYLEELLVR